MKQPNPKARELASRRNKIIVFLSLVIVLTSAFAIKKLFFTNSTFDRQLYSLSQEINQSTPIMIEENIRLERTSVKRGEIFVYHYTLVNIEKGSFDEEELKEFFRGQILENIKNNPDLEYFRENQASMVYAYQDKNDAHLFDLRFTAEDYR